MSLLDVRASVARVSFLSRLFTPSDSVKMPFLLVGYELTLVIP